MSLGIISSDALQQMLATVSAECRIVDARSYAEYVAGHVPEAIWMGWESWCELAPIHAEPVLAQEGYWGVLKGSASDVQVERLECLGLSSDHPIIVYANGPLSKGRDSRIAWMLLYLGATQVFLLNGGWKSWRRGGGGVEISSPTFRQGLFKVSLQENRRVCLSQLKQDYYQNNLPLLVDVRSRLEFDGHHFMYQPRRGRFPEAVRVPFTELFDEEGNFISKEDYLKRIPAAIHNASRLVAYCEVGVRSSLFALLHEVYTGHVIANYDGSIMEWALDAELPII